jgi:hypothetical protein
MEQQEINVYEAIPLLKEVLNQSGFAKLIGKSTNWIHEKSIQRCMFERMDPGFSEDNVELLNYGIEKVVEVCESHRLQPPSECSNRDIYNTYVIHIDRIFTQRKKLCSKNIMIKPLKNDSQDRLHRDTG